MPGQSSRPVPICHDNDGEPSTIVSDEINLLHAGRDVETLEIETASSSGGALKREVLGHPVGLYVLVSTEVWERFSYYGMRALLILYLTKVIFSREMWQDVAGIGFVTGLYGEPDDSLTDEERSKQVKAIASQLYGIYTACVYFTPLAGGYLADRHFGQRKMVIAGGAIMAAGHATMASDRLALVGLALIAVGNGAFKPNISTQVGGLYARDKTTARRDSAFSIFYCGINLGAAIAPIVTGSLRDRLGFPAGFTAAGVGMGAGLVVFILGNRYLPPDAFTASKAKQLSAGVQPRPAWEVVKANSRRVGGVVMLMFLNVFFWGVYEQQGDSLALFIDERVARGSVPAEYFQSINPVLILCLTPPISALWRWQAQRGTEPHQVVKMAIGCWILGLAFLVLALFSNTEEKVSAFWVVLMLFLLTVGELYLSPVGLSFVTQVSPKELTSQLMGVWFLSSFFGNYMAGWLGSFYPQMSNGVFWGVCCAVAMLNGTIMAAVARPLRLALAAHPAADTAGGGSSAAED